VNSICRNGKKLILKSIRKISVLNHSFSSQQNVYEYQLWIAMALVLHGGLLGAACDFLSALDHQFYSMYVVFLLGFALVFT
jgi:hypothetical protein